MRLVGFTRTALVGLLLAAMPISATTAAVRPSAAIPAAGSTTVAAQDGYDNGFSSGWIALAAVAIIWAIALATRGGDDDDIALSRG